MKNPKANLASSLLKKTMKTRMSSLRSSREKRKNRGRELKKRRNGRE